jgi:hypothetical protein
MSYDYEKINWDNKHMPSMEEARKILMDYMTDQNFEVHQTIKDKVIKLRNDIIEYQTSVCNVCGNRQSFHTHMNIEHVAMQMDWGFGSMYDGFEHKLTLCDKCYDEHIMKGPLGKFVQIKRYC